MKMGRGTESEKYKTNLVIGAEVGSSVPTEGRECQCKCTKRVTIIGVDVAIAG
jgi:hypothetical protein